MNSEQVLTGEDLEQIYLTDKSTDLLKDPNNLKILLNHALNKKDRMDSNSNMEIIDFCVDGLESQVPIDDERIAFMQEKQEFIAREQEKKRMFSSFSKVAAAAAMFVVIVGVAVFGSGTESEAGVFDWIRSLITREKDGGEQLSISSPDSTLMKIEEKEGHLPDSLPDNFEFITSYVMNTSHKTKYMYEFEDINTSNILYIEISESADFDNLVNAELEINKNSSNIVEEDNIIYYYSANEGINYISWAYNNKIYKIRGNFNQAELDSILSFYKEEQH